MKRLLIISSHFPPDGGAGTHRIVRFARHLHAYGWEISVLTMDPQYYPSGTQTDTALLSEVPDDVRVYRTKVLRGVTTLIRVRDWLKRAQTAGASLSTGAQAGAAPSSSLTRKLKDMVTDLCSVPDRDIGWFGYAVRRGEAVIRRHRIDMIFSSAPPFTCHVIAGALRRRCKVKWVADFRDPWARAPWARDNSAPAWKRAVQRVLERRTVQSADAVILNTQPMHDDFAAYYGPAVGGKLHTVTNGYDAEQIDPYRGAARDTAGTLVLTHAGSLYRERSPKTLLVALASAIQSRRIPSNGIQVHFVGWISDGFGVPALLKELKLESVVHLTPPIAHRESLKMLAASHVLLVMQPGTHLQVPVKLYEYMAFRKPILALAEPGAVADIVHEGRLGLVVGPEDRDGIERALCQLYEHRDRLSDLFPIDVEYVTRYDGRILSRQLKRVLERVSDGYSHDTHS